LKAFLPQSSVFAICADFLPTPLSNAVMLLYDLPEIEHTLAYQCSKKKMPLWVSESHSTLSCERASSALQLVPLSRRRICTAVYHAVHRLPELDTLLDKEPLWRPEKDMKKANTRHVLTWPKRNTITVSVPT
jgi:hypothetical protein